MKKIILFALLITLVISCSKEQDGHKKSGKEILLEFNKASLALKSIDFSVNYFYDDMTDNREAYSADLEFYIQRNSESSNRDLPYEFYINRNDGTKIIYKDDISYFVDETAKTLTKGEYDTLNFVLGVDGNYIQSLITEMMVPINLEETINNIQDTINALPNETLNSEECFVINTEKLYEEYGVTMVERTWISVNDYLPRKAVRLQVKGTDTLKMISTFNIKSKDFDFDETKLSIDFASNYTQDLYRPEPPKEPLKAGDKAPDFELVNHDGKTVTLMDFKGKVLLIDFWGTWCHWCVKSFPKLEQAYKVLKGKDVEFLGISCQEPKDADPVKFARDKGIEYPILLNGDKVANDFMVEGFPTFYIVDKEGKVVLSQSGYSETLDQFIIDEINKKL